MIYNALIWSLLVINELFNSFVFVSGTPAGYAVLLLKRVKVKIYLSWLKWH